MKKSKYVSGFKKEAERNYQQKEVKRISFMFYSVFVIVSIISVIFYNL